MVSPIVITGAYGLRETSSHFGEADTVWLICYFFNFNKAIKISMSSFQIISLVGVAIISYLIAVLFVIFYELPFQRLSDKFILKKVKKISNKT